MKRKQIIKLVASLAAALVALAFFTGYSPGQGQLPPDNRLSCPEGGFVQVRTYYEPITKSWHIKRLNEESNK